MIVEKVQEPTGSPREIPEDLHSPTVSENPSHIVDLMDNEQEEEEDGLGNDHVDKNSDKEELYELNLGNITKQIDNVSGESARGVQDARRSTILIAYFLCSISTLASHIIRKPLATAKVNIQRSFKSSTFELSYLDTSFLLFYSFGQLVTPSIFPKSHTVLLASFCHLIIGVSLILLLFCGTLSSFVVIYGIIGFSCAPAWTLIFQDLHVWLPTRNRHLFVTLWCCKAELGYIIGTIVCARIQTDVNWRCLFVMGGCLNLLTWIMILSCYIEPGHEDILYIPNGIINPITIGKANLKRIVKGVDNFLKRYRTRSSSFIESGRSRQGNESEPSSDGIPIHTDKFGVVIVKDIDREVSRIETSKVLESARRGIKKFSQGLKRHVLEFSDVAKRVQFLNHNAFAYTLVRIAKNCFSFWISFFLTTHLGYSIKNGIYTTLLFELGSCMGSLISGLVSKLVLTRYPITSSAIASIFASISIFSLLAVDLSEIRTAFCFIFIIGTTITCVDTLMITRNIRAVCEDCKDATEKDFVVSCSYIFTVSTFISVIQSYFTAYIADVFGWNQLFLYLGSLLLISTGVLGIHSRYEVEKMNATIFLNTHIPT